MNDFQNIDGILAEVARVIISNNYKRVVIQFEDKYLPHAIEFYSTLRSNLPVTIDIFITGDSSYGSSVDDISAMHIESDLIVYFGSDLNSSGVIPTLLVPLEKRLNILLAGLSAFSGLCINMPKDENAIGLIFTDFEYSYCVKELTTHLSKLCGDGRQNIEWHSAELPSNAELSCWLAVHITASDSVNIAGYTVKKSLLSVNSSLVIVYVGNNERMLSNIQFYLESSVYIHVNPTSTSSATVQDALACVSDALRDEVLLQCASTTHLFSNVYSDPGSNSKIIMKRYGGIQRAKEASVIGLIVGSMGVEHTKVVNIITRLEAFIASAGKKSYVFIMGRINDAKLCNFPEVDVYCLITDDNSCHIPPKTFPVPVITPYELQIALGVREWRSHLETPATENADETGELSEICQKIRDEFGFEEQEGSIIRNIGDDAPDNDSEDMSNASNEIIEREQRQLTAFQESKAVTYYSNRNFKGLLPSASEQYEDESINEVSSIKKGQFGIASEYQR